MKQLSSLSGTLILILAVLFCIWSFARFLFEKKGQKRWSSIPGLLIILLIQVTGYLTLYERFQELPILYLGGAAMLMILFAFFSYRFVYRNLSEGLLCGMLFSLAIGLLFITRLNSSYAVRQLAYALLALLVCLLVPMFIRRMKMLRNAWILYAVAGILALASVMLFGVTINGATNWIKVFGFTLQPSEFVKISFIMMVASMLYTFSVGKKPFVLISVFAAIHVLILVFQRDLGGALLLFLTFVGMTYYVSGSRKWLLLCLGGGGAAAVAGYFLFSHVQTRVMAWLDPWTYIDDRGYQIAQSLFGIGSGSWFGSGLAEGMPGQIPVVISDFIFSGIVEELGILFGICLIVNNLIMFLYLMRLAWDTKNAFHQYISIGCGMMISMQSFLSIGGVIKLIPSTGVTLPLISYGGSSLISTIMMLMIIEGLYIADAEKGTGHDTKTEQPSVRKLSHKPLKYIVLTVIMFMTLIGYLVYFNVVTAPKILDNPYNKRVEISEDARLVHDVWLLIF